MKGRFERAQAHDRKRTYANERTYTQMNSPESSSSRDFMTTKTVRVLSEAASLLRAPQRVIPLFSKLASDELRTTFEHRHLYSYAAATIPTADALRSVVHWIRIPR